MRLVIAMALCAVVADGAVAVAATGDGQGPLIQPQAAQEPQGDASLDLVSLVSGAALRALQRPQREREEAVGQIIDRYVDVGFILRASVPVQAWSSMSDDERAQAGGVYRRLAAGQYAMAFDGYQGELVDVLAVDRLGDGIFRVRTSLRASGKPKIEIDWITIEPEHGGRPMIRDLVVDGASTLATQQGYLQSIWETSGGDVQAFLVGFSELAAGD